MRTSESIVILLASLAMGGATGQTADWGSSTPLPQPSGSFAVGVRTLHLTDSSRATSRHFGVRALTISIWYPATAGTGTGSAAYLTEAGLLDSMKQRQYLDMRPRDMEPWIDVRLSAQTDATIAPSDKGWPVLVLSHGLGVARAHYSAISQELASHGFVVLAIDHPIGGFTLDPAGRVLAPGVDSLHYGVTPVLPYVVHDWSLDAAFVVRRVARLLPLDTTRAGMLGHSLGGAAALEACRSQPMFAACADMDGDPFGEVGRAGVGRPFLTLLSKPDFGGSPPADSATREERRRFEEMGRERDQMWASIMEHYPAVPSFVVELTGTAHMSFSDAPFQMVPLLSATSPDGTVRACCGITLGPNPTFDLIARRLLAFFDHFLRGQPLRLLRPGLTSVP